MYQIANTDSYIGLYIMITDTVCFDKALIINDLLFSFRILSQPISSREWFKLAKVYWPTGRSNG